MTKWPAPECTLPTAERPFRVAEFDALLRTARQTERVTKAHGRVLLAERARARAEDLTARETECCSFFRFRFRSAPSGFWLDITVPDEQVAVLDALLGPAES
ncbi:hypothetical protein [Cryptosporangium phraense]|uniref:Uncharacterized protein n=1 Tax=Cryptosporangium phraense TaxID=2593070 RepID=A0A545ANS3_9ACTN|nr:hypothetical protein [Cryptosporangium phraense]TQS42967.1 hypothetical protein FL583_21230 [Cryptosporangium phraense]